MTKMTRVLIVEDLPTDAELTEREVRQVIPESEFLCVETREDFLAALASFHPDMIISDYRLPYFDGLTALKLAQEHAPETPFLTLTGSINEETAVDCMKAGAWDYVLKEHIKRLGPAVLAALQQKRLREEKRMAEEALSASEESYSSLFASMMEGVAHCKMLFVDGKPQDFVYLNVNDSFGRLTGLKNVIGKKVTEVIPGIRELNPKLFEVYGRVARSGNPEKLETYVEPLGIWFAISVYSPKKEHFVALFDNITDRKQAEEALRRSEERYKAIFDNASIGIDMMDAEGRFLQVNNALTQMLGYSGDELLNLTIFDITHPDDAESTRLHHDQMANAESAPYRLQKRYVKKDGHVVWTDVYVSSLRDSKGGHLATIGVISDITQRVAVQEERERLASAIEQAAEVVVITDGGGNIRYVNPAFEKVTGYTRSEALGLTPRLLKSGEHDKEFYKQLWNTIKRGQVWSGRLVNRRKDGRLYQEEATISPVRDSSGNIVNFVAVKRDITEHLELASQLLQAQKMEAIGTLAGGVAHDFNNVLQVAVGYSELILSDEELPGHYRADLKKILESARRGADLVGRLMTFSRKTDIKPQPLNLNRRITELWKILDRTIPKMIDIQLLLGEHPASIYADPTQIDQVLMNLTVNARDAMPEGGKLIFETANIVLDEEYAAMHLGAQPGHYVLLTVTDTGTGIDQETLGHIFEPFYTTKEVGEGTGLGLAMVYGIVQQHGGHIRCYSEVGEGTAFKIYFPALVADEELNETAERVIPRGGSETILLVDDEELIRDLGSRILTKAGYRVITGSDGKEALEVYRQSSDKISLVILDLIMPKMGGKKCMEEILRIDPKAKVIIASGYSESGPARGAMSRGAKGFVQKPYKMRELLTMTREVLDKD